MSRPISGKERVKQVRRTQKNGDIYVYEHTVIYDPEKKYDKILSSKLIGKIPKGFDEMIPTRFKRKSVSKQKTQSDIDDASITRNKIGLTNILDFIGKDSGIDDDLYSSIGQDEEGIAQKILSIARFWVATEGDSLPHIKYWQITHPLPYAHMSEDIYHDLFVELGLRPELSYKYFKYRANRLKEPDCIAIDSTTFGTYSQRLNDARQGFNKDGDDLDTIKYLSLYAIENRQPLAFTRQPGNIPDVISIKNSIKRLDWLDLNKPTVVMDAGFYSSHNISELLLNNLKFITRVEIRSCRWIKKLALENFSRFNPYSATCPFDTGTSGFTLMVKHQFNTTCKYNTDKHKAGEKVSFERRLYLHFFLNRAIELDKHTNASAKILELERVIREGKFSELSYSAKRLATKLFKIRRSKDGLKITVKDESFEEMKKLYGVFVLVSNSARFSTFDALAAYRARNFQEVYFSKDKSMTNAKRTRVEATETLDGRFFCQMVALGYREWLHDKIRQIKDYLNDEITNNEELNKTELKKYKNLRSWLDNMSATEILEWFDCIELVKITKPGTNPSRTIKITTETTQRDELFLKLIGMDGIS